MKKTFKSAGSLKGIKGCEVMLYRKIIHDFDELFEIVKKIDISDAHCADNPASVPPTIGFCFPREKLLVAISTSDMEKEKKRLGGLFGSQADMLATALNTDAGRREFLMTVIEGAQEEQREGKESAAGLGACDSGRYKRQGVNDKTSGQKCKCKKYHSFSCKYYIERS